MLDPTFIEGRLKRSTDFTESIALMQVDGLNRMNPRQREGAVAKAVEGLIGGGMNLAQIEAIVGVVKNFTGGEFTFRLMPCGIGYPEYCVRGSSASQGSPTFKSGERRCSGGSGPLSAHGRLLCKWRPSLCGMN